jgi:hypothetical protein
MDTLTMSKLLTVFHALPDSQIAVHVTQINVMIVSKGSIWIKSYFVINVILLVKNVMVACQQIVYNVQGTLYYYLVNVQMIFKNLTLNWQTRDNY